MAGLGRSGGGGFNAGKSKSKVAPNMNVTPLVDVVLVLLIIFMVLAPVVAANFLANLPPVPEDNAPPPAPNADKPLVIKVFEDGHVEVNKQTLPEETFVEDLDKRITGMDNARKAKGKKGSRTVYLDAEGQAPYGNVLKTIDLARKAKASRVVLLTEEIVTKPKP